MQQCLTGGENGGPVQNLYPLNGRGLRTWRNAQETEVLEGLASGETVIRHPANQVAEGTMVKAE